jgi:hypothetical protein
MRFELIDVAPVSGLTMVFRLGLARALEAYGEIVAELESQARTEWPDTMIPGGRGDRLREKLDSLIAVAAMHEWARVQPWVIVSDLEYLRRRRARARRRFLRALRRVTRKRGPTAGTAVSPAEGRPPSPAASPVSVEPLGASAPPAALSLPAYVQLPARRWLELYDLLGRLPPSERCQRGLFHDSGGQLLWDWVCGQSGLFPHHAAQAWLQFTSGHTVEIVCRLLPVWVGMSGCAPVDAGTLESALERIGMGAAITDLAGEWDNALEAQYDQVPFTLFTWVPANGSWCELLEEIEKTADSLAPAELSPR